jgi:hypothetical protein
MKTRLNLEVKKARITGCISNNSHNLFKIRGIRGILEHFKDFLGYQQLLLRQDLDSNSREVIF